jgi:DNA polymerase phi
VRQQGCDSTGNLWLQHALKTLHSLEENKHLNIVMEADEEIVKARKSGLQIFESLKKVGVP